MSRRAHSRIERLEPRIAPAFAATVPLADLPNVNGFTLDGVAGDAAGQALRNAGDVNGDGLADFIIGAPSANDDAGAAYVIFGRTSGFPASLGALDGMIGFRLDGAATGDRAGFSVSGAGDVNGDGFADVIIGAPNASASAGAAWIVFGKATGFTATLSLAALNGTNGFRLDGVAAEDRAGWSVSGAGDVNGDDFDDVIIGAFDASPGGRASAGSAFVIFGKAAAFDPAQSLSTLNGATGFRLDGLRADDEAGRAVSGVGDVNGDGFDDVLVGAPNFDNGNLRNVGAGFVVFGKTSAFSATLSLGALNGRTGFRINGAALEGRFGDSVSGAGDVNGDGFDDLVIGAPDAGASGRSYVIFGHRGVFAPTLAASALNGRTGFRLDGFAINQFAGNAVGAAGDVNADRFDDLLIGSAQDANGDPLTEVAAFVVFGRASGFAPVLSLAALNGTNGVKFAGVEGTGLAVSGAGDVNADGFDDLLIGNPLANRVFVVFGQPSAPLLIAVDGRSATFTDVDGDRVMITTTAGTLALDDFTFTAENALGGVALQRLDLSGATGANLAIAAQRTALGGDGFVNVGALLATDTALGNVRIDGDLGRIVADGARSLVVHSMGLFGTSTQAPGGDLASRFTGHLSALTVQTTLLGVTVEIGGATGPIAVGEIENTKVFAANDIASLRVTGSVERSQILAGHNAAGPINGAARIGAVTVGGNWLASDLVAGISAVDGFFGNDNDAPITAGSVARIASVLIRGQAIGSTADGDHFGIVAPQIGAVIVGRVRLPFGAFTTDNFPVGATGDFRIREI